MGLLHKLIIIAQSMIKEITLPFNSTTFRRDSLPRRNCATHPGLSRKGGDYMKVIRHNQEQTHPPAALIMIPAGSLQD
jgi:hypothetical protein